MQKQFITYEIALKLKELGFNELCFDNYYIELPEYGDNIILWNYGNYNFGREEYRWNILCAAPLWQQSINWLREKHNIEIFVNKHTYKNETVVYHYEIYINERLCGEEETFWPEFNTYEKALEDGLKEVLKLIK